MPAFLKGAEQSDDDDERKSMARLAEQHLGSAELAGLLEKEILSRKVPEEPDEIMDWMRDIHAALYPSHWPDHLVGAAPDYRNPLVNCWEGEIMFGCPDETRAPLPFECPTIWPLAFHVMHVREIAPQTAKEDEAFLFYLEDQRFGLATFACHRNRDSATWKTDPLQIESREVFQYVNGTDYLRLARTEAAGFYSGNIREEWLKDQVVTSGEKFVLVRRTPQLEVALNSCTIIGFQTAGKFVRLTKDFWTAFCKSVPPQLAYKPPADFSAKVEVLSMAKGERTRHFKAHIRVIYIERSWK